MSLTPTVTDEKDKAVTEDFEMGQVDSEMENIGLTLLDQKRKRIEDDELVMGPTPHALDLISPNFYQKNGLRAGPVD